MKAPVRVHMLHTGTSRPSLEGLSSSAKALERSEHAASPAPFAEVLTKRLHLQQHRAVQSPATQPFALNDSAEICAEMQ